MWRAEAVLGSAGTGRVVSALDGGGGGGGGGARVYAVERRRGLGRRAEEPVQAAAAVLELGLLLLLPEHLDAHRLKHPGLHQGLAQAHRLVAGHRLVPEEAAEGEVGQHHVHGLGAQETVVVGLEVVTSALHLHVGLEVGDDAAPDVGGSERLPGHPPAPGGEAEPREQRLRWELQPEEDGKSWIHHQKIHTYTCVCVCVYVQIEKNINPITEQEMK